MDKFIDEINAIVPPEISSIMLSHGERFIIENQQHSKEFQFKKRIGDVDIEIKIGIVKNV